MVDDELEISRMMDEGCPNFQEDDHPHRHHLVETAQKVNRLHRRHKLLIHGGILAILAVMIYVEGMKPIDTAFLALSVLTELQ